VKLVLLSFFIATLIGAVFGVVGLLTGKLKRGNPIPFGPFIGIGALAAYFFGNDIITWYLHSLL
ncbi:hypothetical protein OQ279_17655, partial [Salinimicrobium sp. MT39]|nr:hypothetical protein [Salinimicrobium profundisediminis]